MRKIHTFLSIISLFVTSLVLVMLVFGWYVTNDKATVSGINGAVVDKSDIVHSYKVYSFSNVSENSGTTTYTLTSDKEFKYNPDFDKSPTAKVIEIIFVDPAVNVTRLCIDTVNRYFPGYSSTSTSGYIQSADGISLSSVIKFTLLNNVTFSSDHTDTSGTMSFTTPDSYNNFNYNDSTGLISSSSISLLNGTASNVNSLFVFIDFDDDIFEKLYSNNIGNRIVDEVDELSYTTDFKLELSGSVVNQ